jgi:hypothetical protein
MSRGSVLLALAVAVATAPLAAACGTDAVGVDACRQIESARCQQAPGCNISLQPPYHQTGTDVDACIRFYDSACLHGLASGNDPGQTALNACVKAIQNNGCSVVQAPETDPACSFLVPAGEDASSASTPDASTDVSIPGLPQDASGG